MKLKLIFEVIRGNFHRSASSSSVQNWLSQGVAEDELEVVLNIEGVGEELEEHNWGGVEEEQRKSAGDEEKKRLEES